MDTYIHHKSVFRFLVSAPHVLHRARVKCRADRNRKIAAMQSVVFTEGENYEGGAVRSKPERTKGGAGHAAACRPDGSPPSNAIFFVPS